MFGGVSFMVEGAMAVAVGPDGLMVRVDRAERESLLDRPGVAEQRMGERVMGGWVRVDAGALAEDAVLREWVGRVVA
ncbi:TfoX/Sxy family protein [Phycicoccus sp. CMS6Z-2]|nr:TfoX/Sxy family protein [Phycicoccus flavus]